MFTGIIEQTGKVLNVSDRAGQRKIVVQTRWEDLKLGESISINGVCLTISEITNQTHAQFFLSEETLERSTLGKLEPESKVNLERALTPTSRMGGHFVQGHVDAKGLILNLTEADGQHKLTVALDHKYGRYCVEKGSIAIEGVSLTINSLTETKLNEFMVSCVLVPHTWKNTTFSNLKIADAVNVEVDVLAKYIERLCPQLTPPSNS
ncbi:MAG: riboflavin synthase [Bdellovibrionota bacterium]